MVIIFIKVPQRDRRKAAGQIRLRCRKGIAAVTVEAAWTYGGERSWTMTGSGPVTAAGLLGAADAATRMGIRRHPVVLAAILSGRRYCGNGR
jgi:hypothetical protein